MKSTLVLHIGQPDKIIVVKPDKIIVAEQAPRTNSKLISKLTAKQLEAALLLAAGKTITETGKQTETARSTIHDWLKDDEASLPT